MDGDESSDEENVARELLPSPGPGCSPAGESPRRLPDDGESSVVLHLDCDEFFLQVHGLVDSSLQPLILGAPCALRQYNDVIAMNAAAKALGIRKHMLPHAAADLLAPAGGHMIHAFWRKWPGPRVNYRPYQAASSRMFAALEAAVSRLAPGGAIWIEKAGMEEAFLDATAAAGGSLRDGARIAAAIKDDLRASMGLRVSVGVARNRLLAKLSSGAVKLSPAPGSAPQQMTAASAARSRILVVGDCADGADEDAASLLGRLPARKVPGLGEKKKELAAMGATSIASLQAWDAHGLAAALGVRADVAARAWRACRGLEGGGAAAAATASPAMGQRLPPRTVAAPPPQSLVVTSWTTHTLLRDVACKAHLGRGGAAVVVGDGRWLFETHPDSGRSNPTRSRWILLAMAMDLLDKIVQSFRAWSLLPTKLTVGWQGCGTDPIPGPGFKYLNSETKSRTVALPVQAHAAFAACPAPGDGQVLELLGNKEPFQQPPGVVHVAPTRTLTEDGPALLQDAGFNRAVAALIDAAAVTLTQLVAEDEAQGVRDRRIGQLTVAVSGFEKMSSQKSIRAFLGAGGAKAALLGSPGSCHPLPQIAPQSGSAASLPSTEAAASSKTASNMENEEAAAAGFDSEVWAALPADLRRELLQNSELRLCQKHCKNRQGHVPSCDGPRRGERNGKRKSRAERGNGEPCAAGSDRRGGRRVPPISAADAFGTKPITDFFKRRRKGEEGGA